MKRASARQDVRVENIYQLDGRVPIGKAIPFGLQHVLAMFVANITPLLLISSVAVYNGEPFSAMETARLLQNCMLIAGIGTLFQLYPVWRIGSGLPVVMGVSFTFLAAAMATASQDYGIMVGAVLVGGCFEGVLGLTAQYWRRIITPLLSPAWWWDRPEHPERRRLLLCLLVRLSAGICRICWWPSSHLGSAVFPYNPPGPRQAVYVLWAMRWLCGLRLFRMGISAPWRDRKGDGGVIAVPQLWRLPAAVPDRPILSFCLIFIVSAVETIGDTTATCTGGLGRDITAREISGSLCVDGFLSAVSGGVFGCSPITSFSQNVGLISMTHVVHRWCIMFGALAMILGGLFPPIGAFFTTLPECVLGGCTVIMFGAIMMSGIKMMHDAGLNNRNTLIAATSLCLGVGVTQVDGFFDHLPKVLGDIFAGNMVAGVFVVGLILELCLPRDPKRYEA